MAAVASGKIKKPGLTPAKAREFIHVSKGTYDKLPPMATMNPDNKDKEGGFESKTDSPSVKAAEYGKDTYVGGKRGKRVPQKKGKMSRADFLKMVREKKFAKKKK